MELEELKNKWTLLEEKLERQDSLKESIIREMLVGKSNKSLSRLINYGFLGMSLGLAVIPLLIWNLSFSHAENVRMFGILALIFVGAVLIAGIFPFSKLLQIDFSKPCRLNLRLICQYKVLYKRIAVVAYIVGTVLLLFGVYLVVFSMETKAWHLWAIVLAIPGATIAAWWEYRQMFRKNVDSMTESLEELKESEEE
jgi:protein-S-isoprenylcysteine O-methyltransferase Ste14